MSGGVSRSWFEDLFGFKETTYYKNQGNFKLHACNSVLFSPNGKRWDIGKFDILTVTKLRNDLKEAGEFSDKKPLTFKNDVGDFTELHFAAANLGAVFQVSSRFNCLQMEDQNWTPEKGVSSYAMTQGGVAAVCCPAALIYRNYLHGDGNNGQGHGNQVDITAAMADVAKNTTRNYWRIDNGFCLPSLLGEGSGGGIKGLASAIKEDDALASALLDRVQVGVHWKTQVYDKEDHFVCQVLGAGIKLRTSASSTTLEEWAPFARLILEGTYEGTLLCAAKLAVEKKRRVKVFLTVIGGDSSGTPDAWIAEAIGKALIAYKHVPLDVTLVHPEVVPDGVFRNLEKEGFGLVDGKIPAALSADSESLKSTTCEKIQAIFTKFDLNGNGRLEKEEFVTALKKLDKSLFTDKTIETLLKAADADNNGSVDYQEFVKWVTNDENMNIKRDLFAMPLDSSIDSSDDTAQVTDEQYAKAFKQCKDFDKDSDGVITRDEMTMALKTIYTDAKVTDEDLEKLVLIVDLNHDGEILFEEFLNWLRQAPTQRPSFEESLGNVVPGAIGAPSFHPKSSTTPGDLSTLSTKPSDNPVPPEDDPNAIHDRTRRPSVDNEAGSILNTLETFTHGLLSVFQVADKNRSPARKEAEVSVRATSSSRGLHKGYDGSYSINVATPTVRAYEKGPALVYSKLDELAAAYGHVFGEFSSALQSDKDTPSTLRMPPIHIRDNYMHSIDIDPDLTWSAVSLALARLGPESRKALANAKIELCCEDSSDDAQAYTASLTAKANAAKAGLRVEGSGCLKERMGGHRWVRKDNDPEARLLRLMCFMETQRAIDGNSYEFQEGGATKQGKLTKVNDMMKGSKIITAKDRSALPPQGTFVRGAELISGKEYEALEGIGGFSVMEVAEKVSQLKGKKVASVNAASAYHAGGAFSSGGRHALEEAWCTVSTLFSSIQMVEHSTPDSKSGATFHQHIPVDGCVVSPNVEIFRAPTTQGYPFYASTVQLCGVLSIAMFNRNPAMSDSPLDSPDDPAEYIALTSAKLEACIVGACMLGAEILVIPDCGVGVFKNDPIVVGGCLGAVMQRYSQYFEKVVIVCQNEDFVLAAQRSYRGEDPRESCSFGKRCDQMGNRVHLAKFAHSEGAMKKYEPKDIFESLAEVVANSARAAKPECRYGRSCHTKTPEHLAKYDHPAHLSSPTKSTHHTTTPGTSTTTPGTSTIGIGGSKYGTTSHTETTGGKGGGNTSMGSKSGGNLSREQSHSHGSHTGGTGKSNTDERPLCKFGEGCYNEKPQHLKDFAHPWKSGETPVQKKLREDTAKVHELITLAKGRSWDNIYAALKKDPDLVNIRPESRDFGLLHMAVFNLRYDPAEWLLIEFNADVHLKTKENKTAVDLIDEGIKKQEEECRQKGMEITYLTKRRNEELKRYIQEKAAGVKNPVPPKVALATKTGGASPHTASTGSTSTSRYPADGGEKKHLGHRIEVMRVPLELTSCAGEYEELVQRINSRPSYRIKAASARSFVYYLDDERWGWVINSSLDDTCQMPLAYLGGKESKYLPVHPCSRAIGVKWKTKVKTIAGMSYADDVLMDVKICY